MNTFLKFASIALVATSATLSSMSGASAQTYGGKGSNGPSSHDQPDDSAWLKKNNGVKFNPNRYPPRYGYKVQEPNETCIFLYNQITLQNMLQSVPRYNECMRRGRSQ